MGCIIGKELAARDGAENAAGGKEGQQQNGNAAGNNLHAPGQKTTASSAVVELYWLAGSIECPNVQPHFAPPLGPQSLHEKLPPPPQNVRRRILFASQEDAVPLSQMFMSGDAASMISDASTTKKTQLTVSASVGGAGAQQAAPPPAAPFLDSSAAMFAASRRRSLDFLVQLYSSGIPRLLHQEAKFLHADVLQDAARGRFTLNDQGAPIIVPVPQPGVFRNQFYLPDEALVARSFFANSLCNLSVGWVKLPAGPVVVRSTRDNSSAESPNGAVDLSTPQRQQQHVIQQQVEGFEENSPKNNSNQKLRSDAQQELTSAEQTLRGYLSATKPVYDVSLDGPVTKPYIPPSAPPLTFPRYLEKYFLYVKRVVSVGVMLSWKDAADINAEFEPVVGGGASSSSSSSGQQSPLIPGAFFTFVGPTNETVDNSSGNNSFSLFSEFFAWTENSFPILFTSTNHHQYNFWKRVCQHSSKRAPAAASSAGPAQTTSMPDDERAMIAGAVKELSLDEKLWLAFQLHFKKFLLAKCRQLQRQQQQQANGKPAAGGEEGKTSVQLALKIGLRIAYDNQHFVAYNSFGKNNIVSSRGSNSNNGGNTMVSAFSPLSPRSADESEFLATNSTHHRSTAVSSEEHFSSFLQFTDTSRRPEVECSKLLSESVVVLTCRTSAPGGGAAGVGASGNAHSFIGATETESSVGARSRTIGSAFEPEVAALEVLFAEFLPEIKLFDGAGK